MAGDGLDIIGSAIIWLLYLVFGIPQVDMVPFFPSKILFSCGLNAGFPCVISPSVLVRMLIQESLVYFGNISEEVSAGVDRVVADGPGLPLESREHVFHLVESHVGLDRNLL